MARTPGWGSETARREDVGVGVGVGGLLSKLQVNPRVLKDHGVFYELPPAPVPTICAALGCMAGPTARDRGGETVCLDFGKRGVDFDSLVFVMKLHQSVPTANSTFSDSKYLKFHMFILRLTKFVKKNTYKYSQQRILVI